MNESEIQLSHKQFLQANRDYKKSASAAELIYVRDSQAGIRRIKKGKRFYYVLNNKKLSDPKTLNRIRKLAIPPAWTEVWICALENGHIQATGLDLMKRKQYKYHELWSLVRRETKFHHLYEFGKSLPRLRTRLEKDLAEKELTQEKVLAAVISLMERTYIRIGNNNYEKKYGSYGLTTLKDRHVNIRGDQLRFSFKGKKGIQQSVTIRNRRLARLVKECRDIPGKELFQYYDDKGERKPVESGMVNDYIKSATGMDFTAKDFRTWAGSIHALEAFSSLDEAISDAERKKNTVMVLDIVSKKLGNSRAICKKYYVLPGLIQLYEENNLSQYISELNDKESSRDKSGLTATEQVLMKILKQPPNQKNQ
ncbi:MAG: DNA topoisomerase I [Bacteroidetes bacterium]|nr:MAG: DNA topoisomerase I [Bacteroidota bacterium]